MLLLSILFYVGVTLAQRPNNASICDYYTIQLYGANTTATQTRLMQHIVSLAFAGGASLPNASSELTGILNPGKFEGEDVNLLPWFNGSIDSTNLNNQPVGIDWLDGGGTEPLLAFLNGSTETVEIDAGSNEYRLFAHFFRTFSFVFGCTQPPARPKGETGPQLNLAYVHKFMELKFIHLSHFINQLTGAAQYFGFSAQDSSTLESQMNARYNVRCSPPVTLNPAQGAQLFSLCQHKTCPLAAPSADCEAYVNLGPGGPASAIPSGSPTPTLTPSAPPTGSIQTVTQSASQAPTTTSPAPTSASSGSSLAAGPIAGIAIGGAAVVLGFIALLVFLLRRRRPQIAPFSQATSNPSYATSPYPNSPYGAPTSPYQGGAAAYPPSHTDGHTSYLSGRTELWSPPPQEMDTPDHPGSPEMVMHKPKGV